MEEKTHLRLFEKANVRPEIPPSMTASHRGFDVFEHCLPRIPPLLQTYQP